MKIQWSWILVCILTVAGTLLLSHAGSKAITVLAQTSPPRRERCIVIDAGHGGVDGGAVSCTGLPESGYNLDIALVLNDLFRFLGYDTRMIRTTDISVYTKGETIAQKKISDLKERVRLVNDTDDALLISIHQNTFPDGRYSGAQVFYADTEGSKDLAANIQSGFRDTLNPGSNRACKQSSGVYLMEHIHCTGILIECGFLSNRAEEANLRSKAYQQKLCCVIVSAADSFLSNT